MNTSLPSQRNHIDCISLTNINKPATQREPRQSINANLDGIKARILASYDANTSSEDGIDPLEASDPTRMYVQLKLQCDRLSSKPVSKDVAEEIQVIRQMAQELTKDYLFDEKDAQAQYRQERERVNKEILQERLRSSQPEEPLSQTPSVDKQQQSQTPSSRRSTPGPRIDIFEDSEDSSSGLLAFLDEALSSETNDQGTLIKLRDMALPKHWAGQTPKMLLRDLVVKIDRYAAVSYNIISQQSRVKRANTIISWQGRKRDEWSMHDVGCHDEAQAEQYIATVALHALTYPLTDGFAASAPSSAGSHTAFRLLPAVYRDLWDELEKSRKIRDDLVNRKAWAKLRDILDFKLESNSKVQFPYVSYDHLNDTYFSLSQIPNRQPKHAAEKHGPNVYRTIHGHKENPSDPLAIAFQARQTTTAYQEMLVGSTLLFILRLY
jgi:ATP-dependent RNA helicase DHX29